MTHEAATIWVIDCTARRVRLKERAAHAVGTAGSAASVEVRPLAKFHEDVARGDTPTLIIWHVGGRQRTEEGGYLSRQIKACAGRERTWIAGFSGDDREPELCRGLPMESGRVAVLWKANTTKGAFWEALDRTVTLWATRIGDLEVGELEAAWLGFDPELEAKLEVLAAVLDGKQPSDEFVQRLSHSERAVLSKSEDIASLRAAFFSSIA